MKDWEYYVDNGLGGMDYIEGLRWLRKHVVDGNIRVKFDDIEITPLIARHLLEYQDLRFPDECTKHPLPPDLALNRPDIERLLKQRDAPPTKRPGRPKRAGSLAEADRALVQRMNQMVSLNCVPSPTAAANRLVDGGDVLGGGTKDAKVRRLVKRYQE